MRLGLVCNDVATEESEFTTTRIGMAAVNRGHEVWWMGVGDMATDPDDRVTAWARSARGKAYRSSKTYLAAVQGDKARFERVGVDDMDVMFLRNDPAEDLATRPWAQSAGFVFGQQAASRGVIVLNDPDSLAGAINKMYFQRFPEEVRPRSLITRSAEDLRKFVEAEGGRAVLKPLQGSGGTNVFMVKPSEAGNLNQIIEAVSRDGYVIAQEYLPDAKKGDVRLFMMNGVPLQVAGRYAAFRRVSAKGDARSNVHVGGKILKASITDEMLAIAEIVRPKLVRDGMFLVGLDIVGTKLMEINVFSPGGLGSAGRLEKVNFDVAVVEALERKVAYRDRSGRTLTNLELAML